MAKANQPIIPGTVDDPTGVAALEKKAIADFKRRIKACGRAYIDALSQFSAGVTVNRVYEYKLNPQSMQQIFSDLDALVDALIIGSYPNTDQNWFFRDFVAVAAQRGLAQQRANLAQQSAEYAQNRAALAAMLLEDPYVQRMALVQAREFEYLKGLAGNVKSNLARVLTTGIGNGDNPKTIARAITQQTGIEARRAERLARTEITTALRRARLDEAAVAARDFGIRSLEMHLSALSPTTRPTHASRHGKLYTVDEAKAWWEKDANSINCKCSTTTVMVDASGSPLAPGLLERAGLVKRDMEKRGYAWSK